MPAAEHWDLYAYAGKRGDFAFVFDGVSISSHSHHDTTTHQLQDFNDELRAQDVENGTLSRHTARVEGITRV